MKTIEQLAEESGLTEIMCEGFPCKDQWEGPGSPQHEINRFAALVRAQALEEAAVIDECDFGHKFAKLPDHPMRNGLARCPRCMGEGLDAAIRAAQGATK